MAAVPKVVGDEEIKAPIRLRSAIAKILKIHNSPNTIKPQHIEEMEKNGLLNDLKAEDETIVSEIIALAYEIYNTDEYLKKEGTEISELEKSIKDLEESLRSNGPNATQLVFFAHRLMMFLPLVQLRRPLSLR